MAAFSRWRPAFGKAILACFAIFVSLMVTVGGLSEPRSLAASGAPDGSLDGASSLAPVRVTADGRRLAFYTRATTVGGVLIGAGIALRPGDVVHLDGASASPQYLVWRTALERELHSAAGFGAVGGEDGVLLPGMVVETHLLEVQRSVPVYFHVDNMTSVFITTEPTVADLLRREGIKPREGDVVVPSGSTPIQAGMHIYLRRAKAVTLKADGRLVARKTFADTVAEFLDSQGLTLGPLDMVRPSLKTPTQDNLAIQVIRVREETLVEDVVLPYRSLVQPNANLELDSQQVVQTGANGLRRRQFRLRFEDGVEVLRTKEREWVEYMPRDEITEYGTRIVVRQLATPEGTISYWREMRVFATWYDASDGGKLRSNPSYGYTRLGWKCEKGVVAIDPTVIPFYTRMYVPGYGMGVAVDTGGGIKGRRIDLAFSEGEQHNWGASWTSIYLLAPPPSGDQIRYILP